MKDLSRKISLSETSSFNAGGFLGQVYIENGEGVGFNALLVTVNGHHPIKRMVDSTLNYYVLEGGGTFTLDDITYQVSAGDLFVIGTGHTYEYEGTMKMFEFNISPDNGFNDEVIE